MKGMEVLATAGQHAIYFTMGPGEVGDDAPRDKPPILQKKQKKEVAMKGVYISPKIEQYVKCPFCYFKNLNQR